MGGWGSGPGMMQGHELEEGEACYYKDDTSIDPDVALSYIGDKVQSILGHLQKDFEGGVSAENLGAKFGGYGSFLPMYQRSPSIWSQPKSPQTVQNPSFSTSPNNPFPEGPAPNYVTVPEAPSTQRSNSVSSPGMRPSQTLKLSSEDGSMQQNGSLASDQFAEACPGKVELPYNKSGNKTHQRTLKVRIKMGPERLEQYNAEIHNLGLTSPSSSAGNSPPVTPGESPADILQIMTSFPVSGGLLLSPLCEDLLNLTREKESSVENKHEAARKSSAISVRLLNNDVRGGKKAKSVDKSENFEKLENESTVDLNNRKQNNLESEIPECRMQHSHDLNCKPLSDTIREEKDVQVNKKKGNKDSVKGKTVSGKYDHQESGSSSVEKVTEVRARISQKDVSFDNGSDSRITGNRNRASLEAYSGISEGERVKVATYSPGLKVNLKASSGEQFRLGTPRDVNKSLFEGEKKSKGSQSSGKLTSKLADSSTDGGKKGVHRVHLSKKPLVDTSLEHNENPKRLLERPSADRPKNSHIEAAKAKLAYGDKFKEKSSDKKYYDKVAPEIYMTEVPAAAIPSNEGVVNRLEQPMVAPLVIQEEWVGCDRCQKWRLLPFGTKSEQLPEKWVCSMLDWLPGMNRCDIGEDETSAAVRASHPGTIPENQYNFQDPHPADKIVSGVSLGGAHHFDQSNQNFASNHIADQVKKQKLKEKVNMVRMSNPVPSSDGKKDLQRRAMKDGSSKEVNQSLAKVNSTNKSSVQHPNKSAIVVEKLNKRKGENLVGDDANPRKKSKKDFQRLHGKVEKNNSEAALDADKFETSGGNLVRIGHSVTSGLPNEEPVKGGNKQSAQKDGISGRTGNLQISLQKQKEQMQELPDNQPAGMKTCVGREVPAKKRKLKDYGEREHLEETRENTLQERNNSMKDESKDSAFPRDKKSRMTQIEEEFKRSNGDDISKRKGAEAKVVLPGNKKYTSNRGIEKEQQLRKPIVKAKLTIGDIDKLRQDLGFQQLSTAATSSSSKVSDSRKNRVSYMEMKGSPQESVSSSPVRINEVNRNPLLDFREGDARDKSCSERVTGVNLPSEFVHSPLVGNEGNVAEKCSLAPSRVLLVNCGHNEGMSKDHSTSSRKKSSLRSREKNRTSTQRERDRNDVKSSAPCSSDVQPNVNKNFVGSSVNSTKVEPWSGKFRIDLRQGEKQGALCPSKHGSGSLESLKRSSMNSRPVEDSVNGGTSKAPDASLANKNVSNATASTALREAEDILKEAEELRAHADLIKNSGFGSESNYEHFKAAVKFLQGASLLEACNGESSKLLEMKPLQMYGTAAKLCKTCAHEYEKSSEMAAAALAYKCMEVAYMRVVYCKSSSTYRVWYDLQSSLQMAPPGESPSSSASDVDNLNYLATADKATLSKGNGSHAGNHVMVPRNVPNFVRLLDFTKDVNCAMEAAKKSQDTLAAAHVKLEESQNKEGIVSVKRVIDFSFQDVNELIRLVWVAFNTINHQGLISRKEH
ncbi:hypothetical protein BUALT_Bualt12G0122000 [Buddleja alternifolia]|uniref:CW-type domain-containing protein n=1 Tax=Buddleja alternifolia TaxID=168488 RepID=A0AAV6WQT6_9LAMI|nr:hypothetical protein BUALT_Bualt12G0122000 [Buddleja alternifolia]